MPDNFFYIFEYDHSLCSFTAGIMLDAKVVMYSMMPYCSTVRCDQIPAENDGQLLPSEQGKIPFTTCQMGPAGLFRANISFFFGLTCPAFEQGLADNDEYQGCSKVGDNSSLVIAASLPMLSLLQVKIYLSLLFCTVCQLFAIHHLLWKVQDN